MPGYVHEIIPDARFPKFSEQVVLCHNHKDVAWLELSNTEFLVNRSYGPNVVRVYIGARKSGSGWQAMKPESVPGGVARISLTSEFSHTERILDFQRAIIDDWRGFDPGKASTHAKGTTFGKSLTSASFVAKALKTGYDAVGKSMPAYSGLKLGDWSVKDLLKYAEKRKPVLTEPALIGFQAYAPNFVYDDPTYPHDPAMHHDTRTIPYIPCDRMTHQAGYAYAEQTDKRKDWPKEFKRVRAYCFRGDTRDPGQIKGSGGFNPNFTRPDHIKQASVIESGVTLQSLSKALEELQLFNPLVATQAEIEGYNKKLTALKADVEQFQQKQLASKTDHAFKQKEERVQAGPLNLANFIAHQWFGGFVSGSKSVAIAKSFATGAAASAPSNGWVYACLLEGGFEFPPLGSHPWVLFAEQEIAMPGILDWDDVVACRHVNQDNDCNFDGPIYMKSERELPEPARRTIWNLLSGKSQNRA